jgi:hypothetical protein
MTSTQQTEGGAFFKKSIPLDETDKRKDGRRKRKEEVHKRKEVHNRKDESYGQWEAEELAASELKDRSRANRRKRLKSSY